MLVIGIVGPKASGKDSVAEYISKNYGTEIHSYSEIQAKILSVLHIEPTRMNYIKLSALREVFGKDTLVKALDKIIKQSKKDIQVIKGVRFQNEFDHVRSFEKNVILYVTAGYETRYKRQKGRGEKSDDKEMTYEEFIRVETENTEVDITKLGEQADFKIENEGSVHELHQQINEVMKKVLNK